VDMKTSVVLHRSFVLLRKAAAILGVVVIRGCCGAHGLGGQYVSKYHPHESQEASVSEHHTVTNVLTSPISGFNVVNFFKGTIVQNLLIFIAKREIHSYSTLALVSAADTMYSHYKILSV